MTQDPLSFTSCNIKKFTFVTTYYSVDCCEIWCRHSYKKHNPHNQSCIKTVSHIFSIFIVFSLLLSVSLIKTKATTVRHQLCFDLTHWVGFDKNLSPQQHTQLIYLRRNVYQWPQFRVCLSVCISACMHKCLFFSGVGGGGLRELRETVNYRMQIMLSEQPFKKCLLPSCLPVQADFISIPLKHSCRKLICMRRKVISQRWVPLFQPWQHNSC